MKLHLLSKSLLKVGTQAIIAMTFISALLPHAEAGYYHATADGANLTTVWPNTDVSVAPDDYGNYVLIEGVNDPKNDLRAAHVTDRSGSKNASGNTAELKGSALSAVYGVSVVTSTNEIAANNQVFISDNSQVTWVYGARGNEPHLCMGNVVTIEQSDVAAAYGAYSFNAVSGNVVIVSGANVSSAIGAQSADHGISSGNSVLVTNGSTVGYAFGSESRNNAIGNSVTIRGASTVTGRIVGAYLGDGTFDYGDATGNSVTISEGSTVAGNVYGALASTGDVTGNSVTISNSTVRGPVYAATTGGVDIEEGGAAIDNSVTLKGTQCDLTEATIFGCIGWASTHSGNTLTLDGFRGTVKGLEFFDAIHFSLDSWEHGSTILTLLNSSSLTQYLYTVNIDLSQWNVSAAGESMTLISGLNQKGASNMTGFTLNGISEDTFTVKTVWNGSTWDIVLTANQIGSGVSGSIPEPGTAALSLLALAGLAARRRRR